MQAMYHIALEDLTKQIAVLNIYFLYIRGS